MAKSDSVPGEVVDDLSAYVISGAVGAVQGDVDYESDVRTPAQGIQDAVEAERLGFRAVFLSERWDIKQADVILSGAAALTSRIEVGTGMVCPPTRQPWLMAAFAATMQACYGPRFTLGLGRGTDAIWNDMGLKMPTYCEMADYVDILRRLWRGETVDYDGPVGRFPALAFSEIVPGPPPPVWFGTFARAKGAELLASSFDGVLLPPVLTPQATANAVNRIKVACERIGRDTREIRICQAVITAPGLDDTETRSLAHGRAVGYLQYPGYGETLVEENGWDPEVIHKLRAHRQLAANEKVADRLFHRHQLLEPAKLIPDQYMIDTCAIGSVDECVTSLQRFRDAGADEIATYGSTPAQNAKLIEAWRNR
ncbi:LLM class F420-dependent oxidoreductase [Mycobacterium triplex]|uniref:LLM class F420-dependent oxidoreductase n=1 Tax=Mycobacterium triplex TaxID=47839 RepID=A0A024K3E4_9MYCO|nr:TIGR03857 family LLM class F420-dependent oxidoreductase [Mycobacterium triplex]ORW99852.1 LLM class F420-dependent oxidoreductase [Mycobacterium triplex]CDO90334.1 luciferase family protein [Mycobacterium triplex]